MERKPNHVCLLTLDQDDSAATTDRGDRAKLGRRDKDGHKHTQSSSQGSSDVALIELHGGEDVAPLVHSVVLEVACGRVTSSSVVGTRRIDSKLVR